MDGMLNRPGLNQAFDITGSVSGGVLQTVADAAGSCSVKHRRLRWYILFIHSMPIGNWAVEDEATGG
jgi:hypothetical protein